jgi:hypothetical protein
LLTSSLHNEKVRILHQSSSLPHVTSSLPHEKLPHFLTSLRPLKILFLTSSVRNPHELPHFAYFLTFLRSEESSSSFLVRNLTSSLLHEDPHEECTSLLTAKIKILSDSWAWRFSGYGGEIGLQSSRAKIDFITWR